MPNILDIRRRIRSVRNTQQITRAMKMVAAARLRRAVERVLNARPYANQMRAMLASVAARTAERSHPLLATRPVEKVLLVLVTADRGLCGAFNSNLIRAAQGYLAEHRGLKVSMLCVGRKGRDFFRKRNAVITGEYLGLYQKPVYNEAAAIAKKVVDRVKNNEIDAVYMIYNEFKSVMAQTLISSRILPVQPPAGGERIDYIFEQPPAELLASMLPRYIEIQLFTAILESTAAEHASRMTAMDSATENASEMIASLTLTFNRARQAAITKELIEVVSGADALQG